MKARPTLLLTCVLAALLLLSCHVTRQPGPEQGIACRAGVHFTLTERDGVTAMNGHLSLNTLGESRLAMRFSGQLTTPEGGFNLNRIVMLDYRYHEKNHTIELSQNHSIRSASDTTPDDVFYRRLFRSQSLLLYLQRFNDRSWLVSGLNMPLYICSDTEN